MTIGDFVKYLLKGLCQRFYLKSMDETSIVDTFCKELLEFSRHFQGNILADIFKIPVLAITSQDLFPDFLNSVCSDICGLEDDVTRKFFVLLAFATIVINVSFMLPCYRLLHDVQTVLIYTFESKMSLNKDVKVALEDLEEENFRLSIDGYWISSQLRQLRQFIQTASRKTCHGLEMQQDLASRIKAMNEMNIPKSPNGAESNEDEPCLFCESNCKVYLRTLLNYQVSLS